MAVRFSAYTSDELCAFLKKEIPSLSEDVLETISEQKIDGDVFLEMDDCDEYLKEIAPLVGDRLKLRKAVRKAKNLYTQPVDTHTEEVMITSTPTRKPKNLCSGRLQITPVTSASLISESDIHSSYSEECISTPMPMTSSDSQPLDISDLESWGSGIADISEQTAEDGTSATAEHSMDCCSKEPEPDWAKKLEIPSRFSVETNTALKSGIPTRKARDEIINSIATLILVHTMRPSSEEYNIICKKLIEKHACLKDSVGSGYDSWKSKLRMKFKNLRRPGRSAKAGFDVPPPVKRIKTDAPVTGEGTPSSSDMEEYERHLKQLQKNYTSNKWSLPSMMTLLESTAYLRRKWISEDNPPVKEVVKKFPCFLEPRIMVKEFCHFSGIEEEDVNSRWLDVEDRVIRYATKDGRRPIKSLLTRLNAIEELTADQKTTYAVLLIESLVQSRGKGKKSFFMIFEGESLIIEEILGGIAYNSPFVACFGVDTNSISDVKVVVEKETIISVSSISAAIFCCFVSYYLYNIIPTRIQQLFSFF